MSLLQSTKIRWTPLFLVISFTGLTHAAQTTEEACTLLRKNEATLQGNLAAQKNREDKEIAAYGTTFNNLKKDFPACTLSPLNTGGGSTEQKKCQAALDEAFKKVIKVRNEVSIKSDAIKKSQAQTQASIKARKCK